MNRGLWFAFSLPVGVALAASGCYMGPQPPPPAYVDQAAAELRAASDTPAMSA